MKFRILITDGIGKEGIDLLKTHPEIEIELREKTSGEDLLTLAGGFDALIVRTPTLVTSEVLEKSPRLKLIVASGAGVDNIDVGFARSRNIAVMNCPNANSLSAAEHTLGLLFALARHIPRSDASIRAGNWERGEGYYGTELHGKILGVVGLGNVGRIVAEKAMALGMLVLGYDVAVPSLGMLPEKFKYLETRFKLCQSLNEVLVESDWLTLHIPKEPRNLNLMNERTISQMRRGSFLVNTSRGGIVDEKALLAALESGHLRGSAADVFREEPPSFQDPTLRALLAHPCFVCTAHLGGTTVEARERVAATAAKQVLAFLNEGAKTGVFH